MMNWGALARRYDRFLAWMAGGSAVILFAMVAAVTAEVLVRGSINRTIPGIIDLTEIGIYGMTVLIAPWLLGQGQHIRMEFILTAIPRRLAWACELVGDSMGFLVSVILAYYGFKATWVSMTQHYVILKSLSFPEWWLLGPMPIAFLLIAVEFVRRMLRLARGEKAPRAETTSVA